MTLKIILISYILRGDSFKEYKFEELSFWAVLSMKIISLFSPAILEPFDKVLNWLIYEQRCIVLQLRPVKQNL